MAVSNTDRLSPTPEEQEYEVAPSEVRERRQMDIAERIALRDQIRANKSPLYLDLSNKQMSDEDARQIMGALKNNNSTIGVDFSNNLIGNEGARYIALSVEGNTVVQEKELIEIKLDGNDITNQDYLDRINAILERNRLLATSTSTTSAEETSTSVTKTSTSATKTSTSGTRTSTSGTKTVTSETKTSTSKTQTLTSATKTETPTKTSVVASTNLFSTPVTETHSGTKLIAKSTTSSTTGSKFNDTVVTPAGNNTVPATEGAPNQTTVPPQVTGDTISTSQPIVTSNQGPVSTPPETDSPGGGESNNAALVAGIFVVGVVIIAVVGLVVWWKKRNDKENPLPLEGKVTNLSYNSGFIQNKSAEAYASPPDAAAQQAVYEQPVSGGYLSPVIHNPGYDVVDNDSNDSPVTDDPDNDPRLYDLSSEGAVPAGLDALYSIAAQEEGNKESSGGYLEIGDKPEDEETFDGFGSQPGSPASGETVYADLDLTPSDNQEDKGTSSSHPVYTLVRPKKERSPNTDIYDNMSGSDMMSSPR